MNKLQPFDTRYFISYRLPISMASIIGVIVPIVALRIRTSEVFYYLFVWFKEKLTSA